MKSAMAIRVKLIRHGCCSHQTTHPSHRPGFPRLARLIKENHPFLFPNMDRPCGYESVLHFVESFHEMDLGAVSQK